MTRHGPALLALSVLAIASWTYSVNYDTRAALDRLNQLRAEIAEEREHLQVLRVEWAYLNAPERLSRMVAQHQEALALTPLTPEALGYVAAVAYPPQETPDILPEPPAEMMVAAAPPDQMPSLPEGTDGGAAGPPTILAEAADAESAIASAPASEKMTLAAAEPAETAGRGGGSAAPDAQAPVGAAELRAAITAALIEAGVPVQQEKTASVVPVSAAGAPMPQARPADWSRP